MRKLNLLVLSLLFLISGTQATALTLEKIKYGDFSNWVTRHISESSAIGGKKKTIYAIGPTTTINGNKAYSNMGGSPWATSNVYAKVMGISKATNSVEPAVVNGNKMAKLTTKIEEVKVLKMIDMEVMVTGTLFLGKVREPISSTSSPYSKMEMGMPYTKRPKALVYDLKVDMPNVNTRIKASGTGAKKTLQGRDQAEVYVILQKRWEDAKGNIHALRVGTGRERFNKSIPLTKGHQLTIMAISPANRSTSPIWACSTAKRLIMPTTPRVNSCPCKRRVGRLQMRLQLMCSSWLPPLAARLSSALSASQCMSIISHSASNHIFHHLTSLPDTLPFIHLKVNLKALS